MVTDGLVGLTTRTATPARSDLLVSFSPFAGCWLSNKSSKNRRGRPLKNDWFIAKYIFLPYRVSNPSPAVSSHPHPIDPNHDVSTQNAWSSPSWLGDKNTNENNFPLVSKSIVFYRFDDQAVDVFLSHFRWLKMSLVEMPLAEMGGKLEIDLLSFERSCQSGIGF